MHKGNLKKKTPTTRRTKDKVCNHCEAFVHMNAILHLITDNEASSSLRRLRSIYNQVV